VSPRSGREAEADLIDVVAGVRRVVEVADVG